ncbi:MAG: hypothetical protein JEZ01_04995 [Labilibaculum sp.]|nr:hypothetical protein [Labilibaculum sp.]MBI9057106.1 hypothetical protein [Labilibaculum sp.]
MKIKDILVCSGLIIFTGFSSISQVQVDIDLQTKKMYGKVAELDRSKFFNMHAQAKSFNSEELAYLQELGVGFGRSFSAPTVGQFMANETPSKANHLKRIKSSRRKSLQWMKTPIELDRSMIFTSHPTHKHSRYAFQWKGKNADYSQEAEYIARVFKNLYGKSSNGELPFPKFYEPMNEPFVHAKDIKGIDSEDVRVEMCRFHKSLAEKLHTEVPEVMIGGFASAWPSFELWDFRHWNERMKLFMDLAGDEMDFLSYHIYDGKNVTGGDSFRSGSNAEAIMDVIDAYATIKWGKTKPILMSEHGITRPDWIGSPYSELRDWKNIRSINHQMMQFMDRPDQIAKVVSFITAKAKWFKTPENHPYPWVSMRKVNGKYEWTHLIKFYEFWKDIQGSYSDIQVSDPDILAHSFIHENKAFIALSNLEHNEKNIDLNFINLPKVKSLKIRRLYLSEGKPNLDIKSLDTKIKHLSLAKDEAVILEYTFEDNITQSETLQNRNYFADEYLLPIEDQRAIKFNIKGIDSNVQRASLKIGIARPLDKSLNASLAFNGKNIKFPSDWKGYDQSDRTKTGFFGVMEVNIPSEIVKEDNTIEISFNGNGGRVSSVKLSVLNNVDYIK